MKGRGSIARLLDELKLPLTDATLSIAILAFTLLTLLAREARIFGIWLAAILAPALWRYLLMLLEARVYRRSMPVASLEIFNVIDNFWSLAPLILVALSIWGSVLLYVEGGALAAALFGTAVMAALPASIAILALTRSPATSLNPVAIGRVMAACGPAYLLAPGTFFLGSFLCGALDAIGAPALVTVAVGYYVLFAGFILTGSLLDPDDLRLSISPAEPLPPDEEVLRGRCLEARRRVLTHSYGFFARDNRAGGLAHVRDALRAEDDDDEAWRWYLDRMFGWESPEAALMLAQLRLGDLLQAGREVDAVKLMSRCLLADARFRPLPGDRDDARRLLERMRRPELLRAMDLDAHAE